jgi:hypothetical protein
MAEHYQNNPTSQPTIPTMDFKFDVGSYVKRKNTFTLGWFFSSPTYRDTRKVVIDTRSLVMVTFMTMIAVVVEYG